MNRFFALGLCGLLVVSMCTELFAGQFEACEASKGLFQELGVYGLCNAWHNAETDEERQTFADKFEDKAGFEPPWLAQPVCPCFSLDSLAYPGIGNGIDPIEPSSCGQGPGVAVARYEPNVENLQYIAYPTVCFFVNNTGFGPASQIHWISGEQVQGCLDAVSALIMEDFGEITCSQ